MMRDIAVIFLIITLIGSQSRIPHLDGLCNCTNSYECAQKLEKYQLNRYKNFVIRQSDRLLLKLDNGGQLTLEDIDKEGNETELYTFRELLENLNIYVIQIHYYEGGEYMLINKNSGEKIKIVGKIKVSPDKQRLVSYNVDLEAHYCPNGFQIIRLLNDHFVEEYQLIIDEWGPSNVKWISNTKLEFEKIGWQDAGLKIIGKVRYIYRNNKWIGQ
ncbi:MAG: hypothetical protein AB1422_17530 [bacterium]